MKTRKFDGSDLRRVLAGMITNQTVCHRIASQWVPEGLFDAPWANLVGGWCVDYSRKYGDPPNGELRSIFEDWALRNSSDEKTVTAVEEFLAGLSDDHRRNGEQSTEYLIDLAGRYFDKVRYKRELEAAKIDLEDDRVQEAKERISRLYQVNLGTGSYIQPLEDFSLWQTAFETERKRPLLTFDGALGRFFEGAFCRGEFYSFMGPDKTGKTTYLIDVVYRAIRRRNRVAFFDTGDGGEVEALTRLACRTSDQPEFAGEIEVPIKFDDDGELQTEVEKKAGIDAVDAFRELRRVCRYNDQTLRVSCHPNSSISADGLEGILSDWERDSWRPDVVVIDYADLLAPPRGVKDMLEQTDVTWKKLRRLSQERHCLVVTATQSNAAAYGRGKGLLGRQHFSGRKTKLAHVNGMIGINVSEEERQNQMARLNWVVRRKIRNRRRARSVVTVAGCFDIENPAIISRW